MNEIKTIKNIDNLKIKQNIYDTVAESIRICDAHIATLSDRVTLDAYSNLVTVQDGMKIWTEALQCALREHEIVTIPASEQPYFIDKTVIIPSNRRIEAHGATVRLTPNCTVLMLRNEHTMDGTHMPLPEGYSDHNISIDGGRWEESNKMRLGYGSSGKYDEAHSFFGVSTMMLFNNIENITLTNITFAHTAGFSAQFGHMRGAHFENIRFDSCYADGLHINGDSTNILVKNVKGDVGDDLVALNMYDWQNSSINFGPTNNVVCEDLELYESGKYKALRIEPGVYTFDDGSTVDCSLTNALFRKIRGIKTFKLYFQTPAYKIGTLPERGAVGSADNLFFEDIEIDLSNPIDKFAEYMNSDPVRGMFAAFEIGANIGHITFENISIRLYEKYPLSRMICIGPKSVRTNDNEIFDPYLSSEVRCLTLDNICVNSKPCTDILPLVAEISFDDINGDGHSTASGTIREIILNGKKIKTV